MGWKRTSVLGNIFFGIYGILFSHRSAHIYETYITSSDPHIPNMANYILLEFWKPVALCRTDILAFYLTYILAYFLAYILAFYLAYTLTYVLPFCRTLYLSNILAFYFTVEVQRRSLRSDGGGWGPTVLTAILSWRRGLARSLANRIGETLGKGD